MDFRTTHFGFQNAEKGIRYMLKLMKANKLDYRINGSAASYHIDRLNGTYEFDNPHALDQFELPAKGTEFSAMVSKAIAGSSLDVYMNAKQLMSERIERAKRLCRMKVRARFSIGLKLKNIDKFVTVVFTEEIIYSPARGMFTDSYGRVEINYAIEDDAVAEVELVPDDGSDFIAA